MATLPTELERLLAEHATDDDHQGAAAVRRRQQIMQMVAGRLLRTAADQFAAGTVLIESEQPNEVEAAQQLALQAMATERRARRLAATAYDRLRRLAGAPQKFGTQLLLEDGRLQLWPIDAATTDSERAKWDVPALAELQRRASLGGGID